MSHLKPYFCIMKSGRLELIIHAVCWSMYTILAVYGRGSYWDEMAQASMVMAFVSFPVAFWLNTSCLYPLYFNRKKWAWYIFSLLLVYLCLETIRALWVAADPDSPGFRYAWMGAHDVLTPVFFGYIFSFVYVSAKNWSVQNKEIERLKKESTEVQPAMAGLAGTLPVASESPATPNDFFFVQTGNARKRIAINDLLYISGEGNYVYYVTAAEKILVRKSIREVSQTLPASNFIQIHRSYIVALARIEKILDNHVYITGERLPIGSTYREPFFQTIESLQR